MNGANRFPGFSQRHFNGLETGILKHDAADLLGIQLQRVVRQAGLATEGDIRYAKAFYLESHLAFRLLQRVLRLEDGRLSYRLCERVQRATNDFLAYYQIECRRQARLTARVRDLTACHNASGAHLLRHLCHRGYHGYW